METRISRFKVGQRVWTPMGDGRTTKVEDCRINDGDFMWNVMLDRADPESYEEMFFERNLRELTPSRGISGKSPDRPADS